MRENELSQQIIGAAVEVHRHLGPGLLESAYEGCLAYELAHRGIAFERQKPIPVVYKDVHLDVGFRADLIIDGLVIVELKAIDGLTPVHTAQMMTYLKLTGCRLGLLINFNAALLKDGIRRVVMGL